MRYPKVEVKPSTTHGMGLFVCEDVPKYEWVIEYKGKRWEEKALMAYQATQPKSKTEHTFLFGLTNGQYIDGGAGKWNNARYANHSCMPNIAACEDGNRIWFFALKNLKAGDELFLDYWLSKDPKLPSSKLHLFRCYCGTKRCRGTMLAL